MDKAYFFDTYAVIETLKGNLNYLKYRNCNAVVSKLNIFEIYYYYLREFGKEYANKVVDIYYNSIIEFNQEIIKEAAKFKLENKKRNLSMADCIGYITALKLKIKYLTGDKEFINLVNVEFVK